MSVTRRTFLRTASVTATAIALSACGATPTPIPPTATKPPAPTNTPVPATAPAGATAAPAAPTATKAAPTPAPPTATPLPAKDTTSPKWLLPDSGGIPLPIAKDKITFTYWCELSADKPGASMKSFNEMACYIEQEKRTNIHLEFQHAATGQVQDQFNLMMASRKFPDIIEYNWLNTYPGGGAKALKDGVIIRLNSLIDQYAPNFKNCLTKNPEMRKQVVNDDGDIYCFPFLRGDPRLLVFYGPTIRSDYLTKLNLQIPTTVDEWHDMLVAFKTKDPDGNGKADSLPFSPAWGTSNAAYNAFVQYFVVGAYGIGWQFYNDGGKVKFGPLEPAFKDFLTTMAAWYKEGLIDPDWVSTDQKLRDSKITTGQLCSWLGLTGGGIGYYKDLMKGKEPASFNLVGAPYPTLKKGDKQLFGHMDNVFPGSFDAAITTACKNVKEAVQLLDYAYSYDGHILFNFGVEGLSFNWVNGYPKYTDVVTKNPQYSLSVAMARYFRSNFAGPFVQDVRYFEQFLAYPEQVKAVETWSTPTHEKQMPPVTQTADESKEYAAIMQDVNTLQLEAVAKTITGQSPVSDWDKTVAQMKQFKIDRAVELRQAALDRYLKR